MLNLCFVQRQRSEQHRQQLRPISHNQGHPLSKTILTAQTVNGGHKQQVGPPRRSLRRPCELPCTGHATRSGAGRCGLCGAPRFPPSQALVLELRLQGLFLLSSSYLLPYALRHVGRSDSRKAEHDAPRNCRDIQWPGGPATACLAGCPMELVWPDAAPDAYIRARAGQGRCHQLHEKAESHDSQPGAFPVLHCELSPEDEPPCSRGTRSSRR